MRATAGTGPKFRKTLWLQFDSYQGAQESVA